MAAVLSTTSNRSWPPCHAPSSGPATEMTPREAPATMAGPPTARHRRRHGTGVNGSQERSEERIPSCGLNAYLRPRRSRATWGNAGPHSGYRHLADQDEAGGSSPGRPTTGLDQRERWAACPELVGRDGCRIKNAYLVTVAGYGRVAPSLRTGPLSATGSENGPERTIDDLFGRPHQADPCCAAHHRRLGVPR